ncbi:hypothetical protein Tco_1011532 [Tanacetum coccineum]
MISRGETYTKTNTSEEPTSECREITFPPVTGNNNSSAPVIIKSRIFERQVNRVYMDSESSCEIIYEHCFQKLKPSIKASKVDSKVPLVRFSREHSWPIGEVPLEITIGNAPFSKMETLNFVTPSSSTLSEESALCFQRISLKSKRRTEKGQGGISNRHKRSCTNAVERDHAHDRNPRQTMVGASLSMQSTS